MKKLLFFIIVINTSFIVHRQSTKKLVLVDDNTEQIIPFANILFSKEDYKGIDSVFYVAKVIEEITISYVGYETQVLKINIIIQQNYKHVNNEHWFLAQLNSKSTIS